MSARSLVVAALLVPAVAPLAAQDPVWTGDRPDAVAPLGVFGDRTLQPGTFEVTAHYARTMQDGIRFGRDLIDPLSLFDFFDLVPYRMITDGYFVGAAAGLTDHLTVSGRMGFLTRTREQVTEDLLLFMMESQGITDLEVQALYGIWDEGAIRAHLHGGLSVPTGNVGATGGFGTLRAPGTLPYDMQIGAGAWGFTPGLTAQIMNESGTVGGQVLATVFFLERAGWRHGDRVEANAWAAYRLNRFFSASGRIHVVSFEPIRGFDPDLDPDRDPGERPISFAGTRAEIPLGLNLYMPEGRWVGHRLSVELLFPIHEKFDGPWLARDWSVRLGWQLDF